jgi:hypothetical protein
LTEWENLKTFVQALDRPNSKRTLPNTSIELANYTSHAGRVRILQKIQTDMPYLHRAIDKRKAWQKTEIKANFSHHTVVFWWVGIAQSV